jgi:hypothetical protein
MLLQTKLHAKVMKQNSLFNSSVLKPQMNSKKKELLALMLLPFQYFVVCFS